VGVPHNSGFRCISKVSLVREHFKEAKKKLIGARQCRARTSSLCGASNVSWRRDRARERDAPTAQPIYKNEKKVL